MIRNSIKLKSSRNKNYNLTKITDKKIVLALEKVEETKWTELYGTTKDVTKKAFLPLLSQNTWLSIS